MSLFQISLHHNFMCNDLTIYKRKTRSFQKIMNIYLLPRLRHLAQNFFFFYRYKKIARYVIPYTRQSSPVTMVSSNMISRQERQEKRQGKREQYWQP